MENKNVVGYLPRVLFRFYLRLKEKFDPPKTPSPEEIYCCEICKKLIIHPDSKLNIAPLSNKRYIKNDNKNMFVVIENNTIILINHVYSYTVYFEYNENYKQLIRLFDDTVEKNRLEFENEIKSNIHHSLKKILDSLV
jgi:hypothetical protein